MENHPTEKDRRMLRGMIEGWESAESLPIEFHYDGKKISGIPADFAPVRRVEKKDGMTDAVYTGCDPKTGLRLETTVTTYDDYPVYEIVTYFSNESSQNTPILSDIRAFEGLMEGNRPVLCSNSGDNFSAYGYEDTWTHFQEQAICRFTPQTGRSSDHCFPYFKVQFGDRKGLNIAIGWPAQWMAEFFLSGASVRLTAGQETTYLYLKPGEKIRTPKITIMAYEGNLDRGTNLWRRWYNDFILPRPDGKPLQALLGASHNGGGVEFTCADEKNQLEWIAKNAAQAPYSAWWIDAGWYDCETPDGRNWVHTGNWYADPKRFPHGLAPVGRACAEHGMKLLLWFEPERVTPGTWLYREHPEWILEAKNHPQEGMASKNRLLNLGDPACCRWLTEYVSGLIQEFGVKIYRQDFNFAPIVYWRDNEDYDRRGFLENQHVMGYLAYWDGLLERNPGLLIDSCASGGRRNDLETMRRSVPLHPTDWGYGFVPHMQAFSRTLYRWIPYMRICTDSWADGKGGWLPVYGEDNQQLPMKTDHIGYYEQVSTLSPFKSCGLSDPPTEEQLAYLHDWLAVGDLMIRADYYPLTETTKRDDSFFINEYFSPEEKRGFLQAACNQNCQKGSETVYLKGLEPDAGYCLKNNRTGEEISATGRALAEQGFRLTLAPRSAAVWTFEQK